MPIARLFGRPAVGREAFGQWAKESPDVSVVHHYHALRACWPYLGGASQKLLDVGPDSRPWLKTIERFAGPRHQLWSARQGGIGAIGERSGQIHVLPVEFDVWSPLANREAAHCLGEKGFTLVTCLQVIDHLYHPELVFRNLAEVMSPRGVLVIAARNVARLENVIGLLSGNGVAGDLDALIGRGGSDQPRPRVREYCWQELNGAALLAGFAPVNHQFYDDSRADSIPLEMGNAVRQTIAPFVREHGQLQSEMILIFRKAGPVSVRFQRVRRGLRPVLREAHARYKSARRRFLPSHG